MPNTTDTINSIAFWKLQRDSSQIAAVQFSGPQPKTLDEASALLPGGAYTTFRTYHRWYAHHIQEHFGRLTDSAYLAGKGISLDVEKIRRNLREVINRFPAAETRLRISLDLECQPGDVYLMVEPLKTPSREAFENGVKVKTIRMHRKNPGAKLTDFIKTTQELRSEITNGINEILMVDPEGKILEGVSSNFFGYMDNMVWTAFSGVLPGITRKIVLDLLEKESIPLVRDGLPIARIPGMDEAFITSTSRAVLPVIQIDEIIIGSGKPGVISKLLRQRYEERIESELDLI